MPTLVGQEVYSYLDFLIGKIESTKSTQPEFSVEHDATSSFYNIIVAQKAFLIGLHERGGAPMLALTDAGMPSLETLNADLDSICKSEFTPEIFAKIKASRATTDSQNNLSTSNYQKVGFDSFVKAIKEKSDRINLKKSSFALSQTEKGKLTFQTQTGNYVQGYDQLSREMPLLLAWGETTFGLEFDELKISGNANYAKYSESKKTDLVKINDGKVFDTKFFVKKRKRSDFDFDIPWHWKIINWQPNDFHSLLRSGQRARYDLAIKILEYINEIYKPIRRTCNFESDEAVLRATTYGYYDTVNKNYQSQELPIIENSEIVATIKYVIADSVLSFNGFGKEILEIPGSTIKTSTQLSSLIYYLKNIDMFICK